MLLRGPADNEFTRIFENFCSTRKLPHSRDLIAKFIEKRYKRPGRVFRRCHPRDVLTHALNLIHFEKLPYALTEDVLDRAYESCFVQESQDEAPQTTATAVENPIMPVMSQSCSDAWGDQVAQITTAFGTLAFLAGHRNRVTGAYHDGDSARQYGEAETARVLHKLHTRAFADWLSLNLEQQTRDAARHLGSTEGAAAKLGGDFRELVGLFAPAGAKTEDIQRFSQYLAAILDTLLPAKEPPKAEFAPPPQAVTSNIERIA
jgi:hypothetical protein